MATVRLFCSAANNFRQFHYNLRSIHLSPIAMSIKVGDKVPSIELHEDTPANKVNISQLVKGKKAIIFGVPGAFTPGCSKTHLPGYVSQREALRAKGIEEVICVSVNDAFVMSAWGKSKEADGKVRMLADPKAELTKKLGMEIHLDVLGGVRCKRFALVAEDGVITQVAVEPDGTGLTCSLVENIKI